MAPDLGSRNSGPWVLSDSFARPTWWARVNAQRSAGAGIRCFSVECARNGRKSKTLGALTVPKIATCLVATLFSIGAMFVLVGGSASAAPKAPAAAGAAVAVAQASSSMSSMSRMSSMSSQSSQTSGVGGSTSSSSSATNRSLAKTGTGLGFPLMLGSGGVLLAIAARAFLRARATV
jgi:hypothetical protein